jgi:hypothetical protein
VDHAARSGVAPRATKNVIRVINTVVLSVTQPRTHEIVAHVASGAANVAGRFVMKIMDPGVTVAAIIFAGIVPRNVTLAVGKDTIETTAKSAMPWRVVLNVVFGFV